MCKATVILHPGAGSPFRCQAKTQWELNLAAWLFMPKLLGESKPQPQSVVEREDSILLLEETNILERKIFWLRENRDRPFHRICQHSMFYLYGLKFFFERIFSLGGQWHRQPEEGDILGTCLGLPGKPALWSLEGGHLGHSCWLLTSSVFAGSLGLCLTCLLLPWFWGLAFVSLLCRRKEGGLKWQQDCPWVLPGPGGPLCVACLLLHFISLIFSFLMYNIEVNISSLCKKQSAHTHTHTHMDVMKTPENEG